MSAGTVTPLDTVIAYAVVIAISVLCVGIIVVAWLMWLERDR